MKKGLFITFEGADGCGKTTQIKLLQEYLQYRGYEVVLTREPGCAGLGQKIRDLLLNYDGEVSPVCESFLFLADRAQNVDVIVKRNVDLGRIVISDRHTDSSLAYQGYGRNLGFDEVLKINEFAIEDCFPDLTIYLDINEEEGLKRIGDRAFKDRLDQESIDFHHRVKQGYDEVLKRFKDRIVIVDAANSIEEVTNECVNIILDKIND